MKKQLTVILLLFMSYYSFAQISFDKGYFIDNSGQKTECYIKNMDWKNNPSDFEYKLTETSEQKSIGIRNVAVFEIYDQSKFERHTVAIDVSYQNLNDLPTSEAPQWQQKQLFLKVLVEGKASLYSYVDSNLRKYFFSVDDKNIEQLVYKKYLQAESRVAENTTYKKQLWDYLKCDAVTSKKIKNTLYTKSKLVKLFAAYNSCEGNTFTNFAARDNSTGFNLSVKPGVNFSSFGITNAVNQRFTIDFGQNTSLQLGLEAEFVLNFNKNKWAIVAEPTYVSYKTNKEVVYAQDTAGDRTTNVEVDYSAIEVPVGVRHYMFLNDSSKLFVNAFYMFNISLTKDIRSEQPNFIDIVLDPRGNFAFGLGYKYNNKYSIEFRYKTAREMLPLNGFYAASDYNSVALVFGYTIF
ncbi:porin family protein [Kordia jejudonensis]|uniref:hypothetical protein n=1 Tax=Kordia jejudonensis TaxID=1348245 RepID=UPI000629B3F9|nr:hypothetical protein [Kordia jejudonensis]